MSSDGGRSTLHRTRIFQGCGLKLQSLEGQEEAQDQLQGGTLQPRRMHYSDLVQREVFVRSSQCLSYTTCLEIGPELSVHQTRHVIYCTLCYSITCTDHGGFGRSTIFESAGRGLERSSMRASDFVMPRRRQGTRETRKKPGLTRQVTCYVSTTTPRRALERPKDRSLGCSARYFLFISPFPSDRKFWQPLLFASSWFPSCCI
jgi:hypothetical protein